MYSHTSVFGDHSQYCIKIKTLNIEYVCLSVLGRRHRQDQTWTWSRTIQMRCAFQLYEKPFVYFTYLFTGILDCILATDPKAIWYIFQSRSKIDLNTYTAKMNINNNKRTAENLQAGHQKQKSYHLCLFLESCENGSQMNSWWESIPKLQGDHQKSLVFLWRPRKMELEA